MLRQCFGKLTTLPRHDVDRAERHAEGFSVQKGHARIFARLKRLDRKSTRLNSSHVD